MITNKSWHKLMCMIKVECVKKKKRKKKSLHNLFIVHDE